jgi:hypothetical protein
VIRPVQNPLPLPRARGDVESAARCRAVAWRGLAVLALVYLAGIGWLIRSLFA